MAKLAIKGHPTRGKEVIKLLEMLGGKNETHIKATVENAFYYINEDSKMYLADQHSDMNRFVIYTLEEFLEKFPYKVGDKVKLDYWPCTIQSMEWDKSKGEILYTVKGIDFCKCVYVAELQPYKEETMETITIDDFKANTKEWLIDKLHGMIISDAIKTIGNIHGELHKPKYPQTYAECCETLNVINTEIPYIILSQLGKPITSLGKLIVCRDAYWKIAGEQMGLGKPWEPDWKNDEQFKYVIICRRNCVVKDTFVAKDVILAFPTEEMQDAFHENFKELIEKCKEFL